MSNKLKETRFKQAKNQAQDGRSMVEMLGVLAIIGVLSIGGIAGYSWGMDKHVANQILNEINLNSLQLAMLLQRENEDGITLSLGSPYDDEGTFRTGNYGFEYGCGEDAVNGGPECEYINETRYFMTAFDLPERVQKMVAESAENLQYATKVETNEPDDPTSFVTVYFDVDSSVTEYATRPAETESHYTPEVTTTTTTLTAPPVSTTTEEPKSCGNYQCKPEKGEYCDMAFNDCSNGNPIPAPSGHQCIKVDGYSTQKITVDTVEKTFYKSSRGGDWWTEVEFCTMLGKKLGKSDMHMVSLSDLGCTTSSCSSNGAWKDLHDAGWTNYVWTSDSISSNLCNAYYVDLRNGSVNSRSRFSSVNHDYYALCTSN